MQNFHHDEIRDLIEKDFKTKIETSGLGLLYDPSQIEVVEADPTGLLSDAHSDEGRAWIIKNKLFEFHDHTLISYIKRKIHKHISDHLNPYSFNMEKVVIAGGCFASLINNEELRDIDVFMLEDKANHRIVNKIIDRHRTYSFRTETEAVIGNNEYMDNEKIEQTIYFPASKIQLITTKHKTREELIENFDFKHCCISYEYSNDKLFLSREAFDLCKSKTLVPNTNKKPASWRYEKFWKRGWKSEIAVI
jgi:hypothetical protein